MMKCDNADNPEIEGDRIARRLAAELSQAGIVPPGANWSAFRGGRTNRIWRIGNGQGAMVCKLFGQNGGTTLFPNDISAEAASLASLAGSGLAPKLVSIHNSSLGFCLIYEFVQGQPWRGGVESVAKTLAHLHRQVPPAGLRELATGVTSIRSIGLDILKACTTNAARQLEGSCPDIFIPPVGRRVFLHGDVVPGNIVVGDAGIVLIDWQCPALGDPTEDLAVFLSPAMQALYGHRPLTRAEQDRFLSAYGNETVAQRYMVLKPVFHWRMAAHCLWKTEQGHTDYKEAMELELAALEKR